MHDASGGADDITRTSSLLHPYVCHSMAGADLVSDFEFVHMTSAIYPCSDCCNGGDGVRDAVLDQYGEV